MTSVTIGKALDLRKWATLPNEIVCPQGKFFPREGGWEESISLPTYLICLPPRDPSILRLLKWGNSYSNLHQSLFHSSTTRDNIIEEVITFAPVRTIFLIPVFEMLDDQFDKKTSMTLVWQQNKKTKFFNLIASLTLKAFLDTVNNKKGPGRWVNRKQSRIQTGKKSRRWLEREKAKPRETNTFLNGLLSFEKWILSVHAVSAAPSGHEFLNRSRRVGWREVFSPVPA